MWRVMIPDWFLLFPILFPLLGGLLFALIAARLPLRARNALPILFLILQIIALLVNIAPGSHRLALADWSAAAFGLGFQMDGITLLLLLAMCVPLLALWLIAPPRRLFDLWGILVLTAAIWLTTAGNTITIYIAWACFDLTIFLWRIARDIEHETAVRGIVIGQLTGLIFLLGSIALAAGQSAQGAVLIGLALWARLGMFPFHYLLPMRGVDVSDLWFARGIPLIAAANLWLHWSIFNADVPYILIGTLAGVALIVYALWVWREETLTRAISVGASQVILFVPLAITFGSEANVALGLWVALAAIFAIALFEIAIRWRAENLNRFPRLIWFAALFAFAGLPLTPAFLGRLGVYVALWESNNGLLMLIAGISTLIVLIPLWGFGFAIRGGELREPHRVEYVGLAIIALAFVALALAPMPIAHALGRQAGAFAERALDLVIRTDDVVGVGLGTAILVLAVIGSFLVQPSAREIYRQWGTLIRNLAGVLDLEWGERFLGTLGYRVSALVRDVSTITEENPTVWLLFVALWVAIFVMIAR